MLNGGGSVEAELSSVAKPPVVKAVAPEPSLPVGQKAVVTEIKKSTEPAQEVGKKSQVNESITAAEIREIGDTVKEANTSGQYADALRAIATDGNLEKNLEMTGQANIDQATNAPKEGEGALTDGQRKNLMAIGYDQKIGSLQLKLAQTKNRDERRALDRQIEELKLKKSETGITENAFNGLAQLCGKSENKETKEYIEDNIINGSPIVAINGVLESAITDKGVRVDLILNLRESKLFPEELVDQFQVSLEKQAKRKGVEKGFRIAGNIGLGFSLMGLLMAYLSSKEKQAGMG